MRRARGAVAGAPLFAAIATGVATRTEAGTNMVDRSGQGYEAVWAPGRGDTKTSDEDDLSLTAAFDWLRGAEARFHKPGQIVMYAKNMISNDPLLGKAARRWELHSPRSSSGWHLGPTVAVWPPDDATLELAENIAGATGLCVIGGTLYDVSPWIRRTAAKCLVAGWAAPPALSLAREVTDLLDSMLSFDGHNAFIGGGGKEIAIAALQDIARTSPRPSRDDIEAYLRESGRTHEPGPERAGKWYDEILEGRRHRDYRGQVIGHPLRG